MQNNYLQVSDDAQPGYVHLVQPHRSPWNLQIPAEGSWLLPSLDEMSFGGQERARLDCFDQHLLSFQSRRSSPQLSPRSAAELSFGEPANERSFEMSLFFSKEMQQLTRQSTVTSLVPIEVDEEAESSLNVPLESTLVLLKLLVQPPSQSEIRDPEAD